MFPEQILGCPLCWWLADYFNVSFYFHFYYFYVVKISHRCSKYGTSLSVVKVRWNGMKSASALQQPSWKFWMHGKMVFFLWRQYRSVNFNVLPIFVFFFILLEIFWWDFSELLMRRSGCTGNLPKNCMPKNFFQSFFCSLTHYLSEHDVFCGKWRTITCEELATAVTSQYLL